MTTIVQGCAQDVCSMCISLQGEGELGPGFKHLQALGKLRNHRQVLHCGHCVPELRYVDSWNFGNNVWIWSFGVFCRIFSLSGLM